MSGSGSLRTFSKGLNFDKLTTLNAGIGGYYDTFDTVIRKYPPKNIIQFRMKSTTFLIVEIVEVLYVL